MLYAILSDIHANLEAFDAALADAARLGAERIVVLGDIVGYGPEPVKTLARVRAVASLVIAGNHDDAVSNRKDISNFIALAGDAVLRHRAALSEENLHYLRQLPYTAKADGAAFAHGDFWDPKSFRYVDSTSDAASSFAATTERLLFVGHTHVPLLHVLDSSGAVHRLVPQDFEIEDDKRYLVNVGSVGYPRQADGNCESTYVLYDSTAKTILFRRLPFAVSSVMQRGAETPKPRARRAFPIWTLALPILLASAALGLALRRRAPAEPIVLTVDAAQPVLAEKSLYFTPARKTVRANLKLTRGSTPVHLTVAFLDDQQRVVVSAVDLVKLSSRKKLAIPPKAVSARFTIQRATHGATPEIESFAPSAE